MPARSRSCQVRRHARVGGISAHAPTAKPLGQGLRPRLLVPPTSCATLEAHERESDVRHSRVAGKLTGPSAWRRILASRAQPEYDDSNQLRRA